MRFAACALLLLQPCLASDPVGPTLPWGLRIAYGDDPVTSMRVVWSTRENPGVASEVVATSVATGKVTHFPADSRLFSDSNNVQFTHNATLSGLEPGGAYSYTVGFAGNISATHRFTLQPVSPTGPWGAGRSYPVVAIYGDMGVAANAHKTLPLLYADVAAGAFDVALHVGDIACE